MLDVARRVVGAAAFVNSIQFNSIRFRVARPGRRPVLALLPPWRLHNTPPLVRVSLPSLPAYRPRRLKRTKPTFLAPVGLVDQFWPLLGEEP